MSTQPARRALRCSTFGWSRARANGERKLKSLTPTFAVAAGHQIRLLRWLPALGWRHALAAGTQSHGARFLARDTAGIDRRGVFAIGPAAQQIDPVSQSSRAFEIVIRRGPAQSGVLGYWTGQPYARHGYMRETIAALVHHAFERLDLSRIEAACLPENVASRGLLESSGFKYEGVAQSYLQINGRWRTHVLYAALRMDRRGKTQVG